MRELFNTSFQRARNNVREFSKIAVSVEKNISIRLANQFATIGMSTIQSIVPIYQKDNN